MSDGLAGVEQRRHNQQLSDVVEQLRRFAADWAELVRGTVPLVERTAGSEPEPVQYEYRCQFGDGVIRHCTPQQAKQAQMMGRPVEQRTVSDWVRVPR